MIDANRFMRAVGSLLANAVKFTPRGGRIGVAVKRLAASDSGWVRYAVSVEDSGCGMEPEFVKRAFGAMPAPASASPWSSASSMPWAAP